MNEFTLHGRAFDNFNPFIIAEIGVNHGGSLELAKTQIELAAKAGAHAAKFQTYKADSLAAKDHSPAYWDTNYEETKSQHELFSRFDSFEIQDYEALADHCREFGIEFMSTPFSLQAVSELGFQNVMKIASADLTNVPLRRKVASLGKPVILSTGAATLDEVENALEDILSFGVSVTLMHCVLTYPTTPENANLKRIGSMKKRFGELASIGYSDHVKDESGLNLQLLGALELGSCVLEKHFTHDKELPGNDHYHSMDARELALFADNLRLRRSLFSGSGQDYIEEQMQARQNARRRIFMDQQVEAGQTILPEFLIPLRSSVGTEIALWDTVIGKTLLKDKRAGEPLLLEDWGA